MNWSISKWDAGKVLGLELGYVVILLILLIGRQARWQGLSGLPNPIGGLIPLAVPWFGALGATTISVYGAVAHYNEWQKRWNAWHVVRPVVGAITGTMAYLILIGVIQATGTTPSMTAARHSTSAAAITYLVVAFVVGYREETFRTLVKRVVDILLSPGDTTKAPTVSIAPSPVEFLAGTPAPKIVTVTNTGTSKLVVANKDADPPGVSVEGADFEAENDAVTGATINPAAAARITIRFTPKGPSTKDGMLTIQCNAGTFKVPLTVIPTQP